MNKFSYIFFLVLIFAPSVDSKIRINISESIVQSNNEWTRILLSIQGGKKPYSIFYTYIPDGWKQVKDYVYFPKETLNFNSKYPCKVIVKDSGENQIKLTVVFKIRKGNLQIQTQLFPYDYTFPNDYFISNDYQGKPSMVQVKNMSQRTKPKEKIISNPEQNKKIERTPQQIQQLVVTPGSGLQKIVQMLVPEAEQNISEEMQKVKDFAQAETQQKSQKREIQQIFSDLPSPQEIDQIILEGDSFSIIKTIQIVVRKKSLTCNQKIAYLSNFFGRIQSAIDMKTFTLSQLKVIIEGAQNQIQRIQNEIYFANEAIDNLEIQKLQKQILEELTRLERAYDKFNTNYQKIRPNQKKLLEQTQKFKRLKEQSGINRQKLTGKKLQLLGALKKVQQLEKDLYNARKARDNIQEEIIYIEGTLRSLEFDIISVSRNIQKINFIIIQFKDKSDKLKGQYRKFQIIVERLRGDINRSIQRETDLYELVDELQRKKRSEENKIALRQLRMLQNFIQVLNNTLPNIQEEVDQIYYDCFNVTVKTNFQGGKVVYVMSLKSFSTYLKNIYGFESFQNPSLVQEITLTPIHILDKQWKQKFGEPYNETVVASSKEFSFSNDFSCLNPSTLENGNGRILSIHKNIITVDTEDGMKYLQLSSCSRIESTSYVPSVGQIIYWKGNRKKGKVDEVIEVYSATCS